MLHDVLVGAFVLWGIALLYYHGFIHGRTAARAEKSSAA
jgi:hypothetical protein